MRPRTAQGNFSNSRAVKSEFDLKTADQVERPNSGLTTRSRVLKSSSTAYQTWLRRSSEYDSFRPVPGHPRDYQSVQTFNLRPGCQVTKSASQLRVRIEPDEFFSTKQPKTREPHMNFKDMELLIQSLQEQVKCLTVFLEEEQLHHAGTKKRALMDVQKAKLEMEKLKGEEIERILKNHMDFVEELKKEHAQQMQEQEEDLQSNYKKLEKEYKMLQASFKNYRSRISDEMNEKWKTKEKEFEWQKQRAIDNAVDNAKRIMEERFSKERAEIRKEYKETMQQLMDEQRKEMEDFMRRMSDGKMSIDELKKRAEQADALEVALNEANEKLRTSTNELKKTMKELNETRASLSVYEQKFEEKVAEVEDKHRKRIDDLLTEVSDLRVLLVKKAEDLYQHKFVADDLQRKRTQFAKEKMEERIFERTNRPTSAEAEPRPNAGVMQGADKLTKSDITIEDLGGSGDNQRVASARKDSAKQVMKPNGVKFLFDPPAEGFEKQNAKIFSLPPKKFKTKSPEPGSGRSSRSGEASMTLAGPDKIRPRVPLATISLLETANLPYTDEEEAQTDEPDTARSSTRSESRPLSPDVIF